MTSAVTRVEALLARIDKVNPQVNAVVAVDRDGALAAAKAADASAEPLGPLHGVPVTVKDALHVAGLPVTWGAVPGFVADRDATVVARLRAAGAIVVGTTNVAPMLADFGQTANDLFGATNNPWDLDRSPAGSSGGSAAALAAGLTQLEFGSDLAGSIRLPATACGVYGLRPTPDTVPLTGFRPPGAPDGPTPMSYLSALGPLATSAADLRTALRVTGGPDDAAARAYTWSLAPPRHRRLADFRVGVVMDDPACPVLGPVGDRLSAVVDAVAAAGATVVPGWPDGVTPATVRSFAAFIDAFFAFTGEGELGDLVTHERVRLATRSAWARYFTGVDVFLCPANFTTALPHDPRPFDERDIDGRPYTDQAFWIAHASLAGLPSVVAPAGLSSAGLPVGVQIIGPAHEDDTAVTFAELLADVVGGFTPAPV